MREIAEKHSLKENSDKLFLSIDIPVYFLTWFSTFFGQLQSYFSSPAFSK